jgi:hypothetical protein
MFTGSHIEYVARHLHTPNNPETVGLLAWRDHLLYYALDDGTATRDFKVLWGDQFTDMDTPAFY